MRATGHASSRHLLARTKRKRRVGITPATVATSACRTLSVILPAFNEARALPATLAALDVARRRVELRFGCQTEVLVVDNASTDATAGVARDAGARVVSEPSRNVARARNAGASAARGEVLVFVDADTWVPPEALEQIAGAMNDLCCIGGALGVLYRPRSRVLRAYLAGWRLLGLALRMSQGATQRKGWYETPPR